MDSKPGLNQRTERYKPLVIVHPRDGDIQDAVIRCYLLAIMGTYAVIAVNTQEEHDECRRRMISIARLLGGL